MRFTKEQVMSQKITSLTAGQSYDYKGDVTITCPIPDEVSITVKDGNLTAEEKVGTGVKLRTEGKAGSSTNSITISSGNNVVITGGSISGNVVVNGKKISGDFNNGSGNKGDVNLLAEAGDHLTIIAVGSIHADEEIGMDAHLSASGSINLADLGAGSKCDAAGSIRAEHVAQSSLLDAGGSVKARCLGNAVTVDAGGTVKIKKTAGVKTNIDAGGSVDIGVCGKNSKIDAGGSISIDEAHDDTNCDAGGSITIDTAYNNVTCNAGGSVKISAAGKGVSADAGGRVKIKNSDLDLTASEPALSKPQTKLEIRPSNFKKFRK